MYTAMINAMKKDGGKGISGMIVEAATSNPEKFNAYKARLEQEAKDSSFSYGGTH